MSQLIVTFSNQQQDGFRILSDVSQSMFDAMLQGERGQSSSNAVPVTYSIVGGLSGLHGVWDAAIGKVYPIEGGAALTIGTATGNAAGLALIGTAQSASAELRTASIDLLQNHILAPFTLPESIGRSFSVTITPGTLATDAAYLRADKVMLTEVNSATGLSTKIAYATVDSVAGDTITLILDEGTPGATFAINSEIAGYTRLPRIPATAKAASVYIGLSPTKRAIGLGSSPLQPTANLALSGYPLAYGGMQIDGGIPIDLINRPAYAMTIGMIIDLRSKASIDNFRAISAMPLSLLPYLEVTYS
jgi:hypothetical protein